MVKSPRIGFDGRILSIPRRKQKTGTEYYAYSLLEHMVNLDSGAQFVVYQDADAPPLLRDTANVHHVFSSWARSTLIWSSLGIGLLAAREKVDLLFIPDHYVPLLKPCKVAMVVYDTAYLLFPEHYPHLLRTKLRLSTSYAVHAVDKIITISQSTEKDIIHFYGVDQNKIEIVYPACAIRSHPRKRGECTEILGRYQISKPYLLFVGTIQPRKNLLALLKAFSQVRDAAQLVIVGKTGWLSDDIMGVSRKLGLENHVRFTGYVPQQDISALMSQATCFVYPVLYEGFGMPVLEAMASGVPVIASNTSSIPEIVGDAGLLIDPTQVQELAAAIEMVLGSPELRGSMIERGLQQASKFSWRRSVSKLLDIIYQMVRE